MEALAHCLQHAVCDLLPTSGTNCKGILWGKKTGKGTYVTKQEESPVLKKKCIPVMQKSAEILYLMLTTQKLSVCVSSPYSSPHTQGSRPCRRTACPAGGDDSSYSRNNWSGRVYSWPELPAAYVTEPRHISHKPLQDDRREEEKC